MTAPSLYRFPLVRGAVLAAALFAVPPAFGLPGASPPKTAKKAVAAIPVELPHVRLSRPMAARRIRAAGASLARPAGTRPARVDHVSDKMAAAELLGAAKGVGEAMVGAGETPISTKGGSRPRSAPLTSGPFDLFSGGNDPNVAVSDSYVVTSTNGRIRFYAKSGQILATDREGHPFDASIGAWELFAPLFQGPGNVNEGLNLPAGLSCDPSIFVFDSNLTESQKNKVAQCLNEVYDSRVLFDPYRKRFWVLASTRNGAASTFLKLDDKKQRVGRRDRLLLAVSRTEDPREDWNLYVLPSAIDTGKCNDIGKSPGPPPHCPGSIYHPGEGADYPSIGIGPNWVVTTINVSHPNPWIEYDPDEGVQGFDEWTSINVYDAEKLAKGKCDSACGWNLGPVDIQDKPKPQRIHRIVAPVKQRGTFDPSWNLMVTRVGDPARLLLLALKGNPGNKPALTGAFVPIDDPRSVTDMPQPTLAGSPTSVRVHITNLGESVLHAVAHGDRLFTVFQDCGPQSNCSTVVRLVGVDWKKALGNPEKPVSPFIDRRFGGRNVIDDPENAVVWYGNPAVEVNGDGHAVVVYNRSGLGVYFSASYSAWMHGEDDIRPSSVLRQGEAAVTDPKDATKDPCCNMDTGGIAVDPRDGKAIWMLHAYGDSNGGVSFTLGKVFGSPLADLAVWTGSGIGLPAGGLHARVDPVITVHVENGGDAAFPGDQPGNGHGTVTLKKFKGQGESVTHFQIPPLTPGQGVDVPVQAHIPEQGAGMYSVQVQVSPVAFEYSTANNKGSRLVQVAP